ncbi:MAG: DnaB-like helicase C-terminal domain-containing protein [Oscillospiraceae bacterium]|nr:DnaB-like helicase C-terminal domain-containing protein [Oscillospiraceae bacterium]
MKQIQNITQNMGSNLQKRKLQTVSIPSGLEPLDNLTGGFPIGLTVLGGNTGIGKTAFSLQVAGQISSAGKPVLFFETETSQDILASKLVSQKQFTQDRKTALTTDQILYGIEPTEEQSAAYEAALSQVEQCGNLHFFVADETGITVSDIAEAIQEVKAETNQNPVVFVDYLQLLSPPEGVDIADEKTITGSNVVSLYRLAHKEQIAIVALSAFNRENYTAEVNTASFKGSGQIEYVADLLLGLQFHKDAPTDEPWNENPRPMELVVIKNRIGPSKQTAVMEFYPEYGYFTKPLPPERTDGADIIITNGKDDDDELFQ